MPRSQCSIPGEVQDSSGVKFSGVFWRRTGGSWAGNVGKAEAPRRQQGFGPVLLGRS